MYKQKLTPEESLEVIKYRMKYDVSKTSEENKIVSEQSFRDITKQTLAGVAVGATAGAAGTIWGGGVGAVPGAVIGGIYGLTRALMSGGASMNKVEDLFEACSTNTKEMGPPTLSQSQLEKIADTINKAIDRPGTLNKNIQSAFSQIPTIPDLCNVVQTYGEYHGDLFEDLQGDLEGDDEWKNDVLTPLRKAIRLSLEASQKIKAAPEKSPAPAPPTPAPAPPKTDSTASAPKVDSTKTKPDLDW